MADLIGDPEFRFWPGGTTPSVANFTLNQTTDALEFVWQVPEDMTITRLGIRQGTVTGTAPSYTIRLQGVTGAGIPDGVDKTGATAAFTPVSGGNNTWRWETLGSSYAAVRGEWLAMTIGTVGTVDASNNCSFTSTASFDVILGQPYTIQNENGTRSRPNASCLFGYGTSTQAYGLPANSATSASYSTTSSPDERAVLFNFPTTFCASYKVSGAVLYGSYTAGTTFDLVLYDTDGTTVLQRTSFDTDQDQSSTSSRTRPLFFDDTPVTLNAGSTYRLSFLPTTTSNQGIALFTVGSSADMDAYQFGGAWATSSTRTDAGSWTDSDVTRFGINLLLSDVTAPSGGSSGTPAYAFIG